MQSCGSSLPLADSTLHRFCSSPQLVTLTQRLCTVSTHCINRLCACTDCSDALLERLPQTGHLHPVFILDGSQTRFQCFQASNTPLCIRYSSCSRERVIAGCKVMTVAKRAGGATHGGTCHMQWLAASILRFISRRGPLCTKWCTTWAATNFGGACLQRSSHGLRVSHPCVRRQTFRRLCEVSTTSVHCGHSCCKSRSAALNVLTRLCPLSSRRHHSKALCTCEYTTIVFRRRTRCWT
mmetsp:Transcript_16292/g.41462  ORF Transcript_16292/g.41462 Transcript_16292/m.41462 type:complete len:238 (+) Transcript_16292:426-1139(+)